jgi:hypothetical protein
VTGRILSDEEIGEAMEYTSSGRRVYGRVRDWAGRIVRVEQSTLATMDAVLMYTADDDRLEIEREDVKDLVAALTSFLANTDGKGD